MTLCRWIVAWLSCLAITLAPGLARATPQTLRVVEESSGASPRAGEVARGVLSFAPGEFTHPTQLIVTARVGGVMGEIPAQVQPIGRSHPDGSIHHALVIVENVSEETVVESGATVRLYHADVDLSRCNGVNACPPAVPYPITLNCWNGSKWSPCSGGAFTSVCVRSGGAGNALEACFDAQNFQLPNWATINGVPVINGTASLALTAHRESAATLAAVSPGPQGMSDPLPTLPPVPTPTTAGFGRDGVGLDPLTGAGHTGAIGPSTNYSADLTGPVQITIEEMGPLRAVLRVSKTHPSGGGFGFVARIYFYHQQLYFRVAYTLVNEESPACNAGSTDLAFAAFKHIERFAYSIALPSGAPTVTPPVSSGTPIPPNSLPQIEMPHSTATLPFQPDAIVPGSDPNLDRGWMQAVSNTVTAKWSVSIAHRYFEQVGPKQLLYGSSPPTLVSELLCQPQPGMLAPTATSARLQLSLAGGHARTYEFVVELGAGGTPVLPGTRLRAVAARELFLAQSPTDRAARESYNHFAAETSPTDPLRAYHDRGRDLERYVDRTLPASVRPSWFSGDQDYGANSWGSDGVNSTLQQGQYGPAIASMMRFRASGVASDLRQGEDMMRFAMDSSVVNWSAPLTGVSESACAARRLPGGREPRGGGWRGPRWEFASQRFTHTPVISNMYLYVNDLASYYFLTGDRRVVDLLSMIPTWPEFQSSTVVPGRPGFNREFFAPFVAFLDAWEVVGRNDVFGPNTDQILLPYPSASGENWSRLNPSLYTLFYPTMTPTDALPRDVARAFMAGIRRMHEVAVRTVAPAGGACGHQCVMNTSLDYVKGLLPNRYVPWCVGTAPCSSPYPLRLESRCDASQLHPGGASCPSDTASCDLSQCVSDQVPTLTNGKLTPWMMQHTAEALYRHWRATADPADASRIQQVVTLQHEYRSPFGMFQESPLHRDVRLQSALDHVAASSAYLYLLERESMSPSTARLREACPSVDFRLSFRARPRYEKVGFDADLYPFLRAWRLANPGGVEDLATCAAGVIPAQLTQYASDHSMTPMVIDPDLPSTVWSPRAVFWNIFAGAPWMVASSGSSLAYRDAVPTWDPETGAMTVLGGLNDLFGQSLYARIRLARPDRVTPANGVLAQTRWQLGGVHDRWNYFASAPAHASPEIDGLPSTADTAGVRDAIYSFLVARGYANSPAASCSMPWRYASCP